MAQLTVRQVPDEVAAALKVRARRAGRSAEAEHRRILVSVLVHDRPTPDAWAGLNGTRLHLDPARTLPEGGTLALLREDRDRGGT